MKLNYKGIKLDCKKLIDFIPNSEPKINSFWTIDDDKLYFSFVQNNECINDFADWISHKLEILHKYESNIYSSYSFIIEINRGNIVNKFISVEINDSYFTENTDFLSSTWEYFNYENYAHHVLLKCNTFKKNTIKYELLNYFIQPSELHELNNKYKKFIQNEAQNIFKLCTNTENCDYSYSADVKYNSDLITNFKDKINLIVEDNFIFFFIDKVYEESISQIVENYVQYFNNKTLVNKQFEIEFNFENKSLNLLDFDYIKWAIRNVKWFVLHPSFFSTIITTSKIKNLQKINNGYFEFDIVKETIDINDYFDNDDLMLNLAKLNLKYDNKNKVMTFNRLYDDSFINYLIDDDMKFANVYKQHQKMGEIGSIVRKLYNRKFDEEPNIINDYTTSKNGWLADAAGTDDPETMNDVYWNLD